jgi:hypothetical protein
MMELREVCNDIAGMGGREGAVLRALSTALPAANILREAN